jgi:hypothetical protein
VICRVGPDRVEVEDADTHMRKTLACASVHGQYMRLPEAQAPAGQAVADERARLRRVLISAHRSGERTTTLQWPLTPALARALLDQNPSNRAPSAAVVDQYARDLAAGQWSLSHQGIALGPDLELGDGAHRCLAVIKSGVTAPVLLTWYYQPRDFEAARRTWDAGRKRTKANVLEMAALVPKGQGAATTSLLLAVALLDSRYALRPTNDELVAMFGELKDSIAVVAPLSPREFLAPTRAAFVVAHRAAPKETEECVRLVSAKVGYQKGSAAHALVLQLPDLQRRKGAHDRAGLMKDVLTLLHQHVKGESGTAAAKARAAAGKLFLGDHLRKDAAR